MRRTMFGALALLLAVPAAWALDEPKDKPATPAAALEALKNEYTTTLDALRKEFREAKTAEEKQKVVEKAKEVQKLPGRALELAEKNAKDPAAIDALVWVIQRTRRGPNAVKAVELLKDHATSEGVGKACEALAEVQAAGVEPFLRAVMEKNTHREAKGLACYSLAKHLQARAEEAEDPAAADKLNKEADQLLDQAAAKYADVASADGTIGEIVKALRSLGVGKEAPDIAGEDADSKKFKLSDYRGKVILLDFWGNW